MDRDTGLIGTDQIGRPRVAHQIDIGLGFLFVDVRIPGKRGANRLSDIIAAWDPKRSLHGRL